MVAAFMRQHSFVTIISHDGGSLTASHVPVMLQADGGPHGTLVAHLAKANPQWRTFEEGREVLVIFQGPHAYVSPSWYVTEPAVPTWNYAVVHAYGVPRVVTDPVRLGEMLDGLVELHEGNRENRWGGELPDEFRRKMTAGIVGVEIPIHRLEAKFKLSQNRIEADVSGVVAALSQSADQAERETGELMVQAYGRKEK